MSSCWSNADKRTGQLIKSGFVTFLVVLSPTWSVWTIPSSSSLPAQSRDRVSPSVPAHHQAQRGPNAGRVSIPLLHTTMCLPAHAARVKRSDKHVLQNPSREPAAPRAQSSVWATPAGNGILWIQIPFEVFWILLPVQNTSFWFISQG